MLVKRLNLAAAPVVLATQLLNPLVQNIWLVGLGTLIAAGIANIGTTLLSRSYSVEGQFVAEKGSTDASH